MHSVKSEDSDLTCFEHPMSLGFPSNTSQTVVSQHSELIPHDSVIPDDFLDAESQNGGPQNNGCSPDSGPNCQLEAPEKMNYQQQIVDSYAKLEPQLVVPRTRDEHLDLINSRKMSKSLPDLASNVTTMMLIPTNLFQCDSVIDNVFNSITSPVKFVERPVDDALPTAVPIPTASTDTVAATIGDADVCASVPDSLSIPSLNNANHLSKSDTSAFCTPLKSTTPNFEFAGEEIKEEPSVLNPGNGGPDNHSADSSGNNSALNCDSHSSSLEAAASAGMQQSSRHNILVSPLTPPFTPAYYSSYFISNCPPSSRTVTTQQSKPSYTVYNISPIHINSPWPFVNNSNPMLCSVVSSPRPQPITSQQAQIVSSGSEGFSHPQQPLLSSTLSRNPTANKTSRLSPVGSSVRKNLFISTNIDVRRPQPIAPKATLGSIMGYSKKEQVEMLRTYPPRISRKRVRQNDSEEDGAWSEDSPAKRMHRLVDSQFFLVSGIDYLCVVLCGFIRLCTSVLMSYVRSSQCVKSECCMNTVCKH